MGRWWPRACCLIFAGGPALFVTAVGQRLDVVDFRLSIRQILLCRPTCLCRCRFGFPQAHPLRHIVGQRHPDRFHSRLH